MLDPQKLGVWLPLIGTLALEIGAAFSVVLVRSVTAGGPQLAPRATQSPAATGDAVAHENASKVAQTVQKGKSGPPKRAIKAKLRQRDDDDNGPPIGASAGCSTL
jgi:hypothetical protein